MNLIKDLIERVSKLEGVGDMSYSPACSTSEILESLKRRIAELEREKIYAFDLGDSNDGCIGMVARISARNESQAVDRLGLLLKNEEFIFPAVGLKFGEMINIYFGIDNIGTIDAVEEE